MELKKNIEDIKLYIDADQVYNKIVNDLGLVFKSGKCKCFMHSPSADTVMSFDKKLKKLKCFSCGNSYDIFNHYQQHHGLNFVNAINEIVRDFNLNIDVVIEKTDRKPKKPPTIHENYNKQVLGYCEKRGISKETIDYVGVKENKGSVCFEYRNELGEHISNKYRRTKNSDGPKMWFEKDTNINTLFNMDKVNISEPLLITEGEMDTLAAMESGFKNAVSIPSGVNSTNEWITTNWSWLEQFDEIILWFDNDEAGIKGVRDVFNRLQNKTVKIVRCEETNDINELLHKTSKLDVLGYIAQASTPLVDGVATLDIVEDFDIFEAEKLETGIANIDNDILGMVFGSLNVFSGKNGAGKSTILNQIYIGESIRQGYKVFLFSGELVAGNIKEWLLRTLATDKQLIDYTAKNGDIYKRVSIDAKKDIVEKVKDKFFLYDSDNYNIDRVLEKMNVLATRYGVKVFIIDNLMTIEDDSTDEYKAQSNIVKKLKNFAKKYNAMVHLVAHPRKSMNETIGKDDVAGTANITNLADYVTTIERKFEEDRTHDADLRILKNRHTGVNSKSELRFDNNRKRFYSSSDELELKVDYLKFEEFEQIEGEW